ncbi:MAG: hypothetical protein NVSMB55_12710 [Mycobacteriales bacterium]
MDDMTALPRQPLRLTASQDDRVVALGCQTCVITVEVRTGDVAFAAAVQAFFARHAGCMSTIDLRNGDLT